MPVGTVSSESERHDLKTLPPDGYVMVRPLPFGMILERRDKGTRMSMEQEFQRGRRNRRSINQNEPEIQKIEFETLSEWMAAHDFAYCITEHNITDVNGVPLDFTNPMAIKSLDPKVGIEIQRILDEINEPEEDEDTIEDFTTVRTLSSADEPVPSS